MKVIIALSALVAVASAVAVSENPNDLQMDKVNFNDQDLGIKQRAILKLLNHVYQGFVYEDIIEVAKNFNLLENKEKYTKTDVVKVFYDTWQMGMLPRGEVFTISNPAMMKEAVKAFHVLFFAKDFDTFIKTGCWMRQHINQGTFVYALTVAVLHREDCLGITLPAPYEIYPFYFVKSDIIEKAYKVKMYNGKLESTMMQYYGKYYNIYSNDKNMVTFYDTRDIKTIMNYEDSLTYFTEDIDLNTYYYYFNMEYPMWMGDDVFGLNKERSGEMYYYVHQQLIARYNLERLSNKISDVKMLNWDLPLKTGYWPRLRNSDGIEMPVRSNDFQIVKEENTEIMLEVEDYERRIRDAVLKGFVTLRDGTRINLKNAEDIELLGRLVLGNLDKDDVKFYRYLIIFMKAMLLPTDVKNSLNPTVMDQYETALRDPVFWQLQRRLVDYFLAFKKLLPSYTRDELDFSGVVIESVTTDKLVTFFDDFTFDITNAVILSKDEIVNHKADFTFFVKQQRLNHEDFKINIDIESDKSVNAVVRIFLGPKHDSMGKLLTLNEKRMDFVEIDAFIYSLKSGKNILTRDSTEMHNIIDDRQMTRMMWDKTFNEMNVEPKMDSTFWYKNKLGFPKRLLLPKGTKGGMEMQLFVVVTPVQMDKMTAGIDINYMKENQKCRWTVCMDSKALGFPLDRTIDPTQFLTKNMRFVDVLIFNKNLDAGNRVDGANQKTIETEMKNNMYVGNNKEFINNNMMLKHYYNRVNLH